MYPITCAAVFGPTGLINTAKSSFQPWELYLGFGVSLVLERLGVLQIQRALLIPAPPESAKRLAHD